MVLFKINQQRIGCQGAICCGKFHVHWNMASCVLCSKKVFLLHKTNLPFAFGSWGFFSKVEKSVGGLLMNKTLIYGR